MVSNVVLLLCLSRIKFLNLVQHGSSTTFGTGLNCIVQEEHHILITDKPDGEGGETLVDVGHIFIPSPTLGHL